MEQVEWAGQPVSGGKHWPLSMSCNEPGGWHAQPWSTLQRASMRKWRRCRIPSSTSVQDMARWPFVAISQAPVTGLPGKGGHDSELRGGQLGGVQRWSRP
jgi:hypothetical protein